MKTGLCGTDLQQKHEVLQHSYLESWLRGQIGILSITHSLARPCALLRSVSFRVRRSLGPGRLGGGAATGTAGARGHGRAPALRTIGR